MADIDTSLYMMSVQENWPMGDRLPLKKPLSTPGPLPVLGWLRKEGCRPTKIYDNHGHVIAEYENAVEAVKDGWRVD